MLDLTWYTTLEKPALTPPVWVFAPAWIFLYITIFAALLLFTVTRTRKSKIMGYTYFILQVILNILWTPSFFILNNPALALIDIIALDIFVLLNIIEFYKISKFSGLPKSFALSDNEYCVFAIHTGFLSRPSSSSLAICFCAFGV